MRLRRSVGPDRRVPLTLKLAVTGWVVVLAPVYTVYWGPANFLWFSNIALLTTTVALWLESRRLVSTMAVAVMLPETIWLIDFLGGLVWQPPIGLAGYMFDQGIPRFVRALSLYHVALPPMLLWLTWRLGYWNRAYLTQVILACVVLPVSWLMGPEKNINRTWGFAPGEGQDWVHPLLWLIGLMVLAPLVIWLPTHLALKKLFGREQ